MSNTIRQLPKERKLVYNAVKCLLCGKIIESTFRHDYKTCGCRNEAMVDGGLDYQRYGGMKEEWIKPIAIFADDDFEIVRHVAFRVNQKHQVVRIADMSSDWLDNAIDYCIETGYGKGWHLNLLIKEKQYRFENEIYVEENAIEGRDYIRPKAHTIKEEPKTSEEVQIDYDHEQGSGW